MGTPDFAVPSLEALIKAGFNVVAVVTGADKPGGRGLAMQESAIKKCAVAHNIPVLQPLKLKSKTFLAELASYKADLQIVVAFRMLPEVIWSMPPKGTFNLHASLLPQYRGAAPIHWAIINGETETGVTTFMLQHKIDTGNIIFQEKIPIGPEDKVGTIYPQLMKIGGELVVKTAQAIADDNYTITPQPEVEEDELKHAPKIFKETCLIDWTKTNKEIIDFVRGMDPSPGAWSHFMDKTIKIFTVEIVETYPFRMDRFGEFFIEDERLVYKTGDGFLAVTELQYEGKRRMPAELFLRGFRY